MINIRAISAVKKQRLRYTIWSSEWKEHGKEYVSKCRGHSVNWQFSFKM